MHDQLNLGGGDQAGHSLFATGKKVVRSVLLPRYVWLYNQHKLVRYVYQVYHKPNLE